MIYYHTLFVRSILSEMLYSARKPLRSATCSSNGYLFLTWIKPKILTMKDITSLFKATVKALKSRNKAQGITTGPDKSILPTSKKCSDFGAKSKLVVSKNLFLVCVCVCVCVCVFVVVFHVNNI